MLRGETDRKGVTDTKRQSARQTEIDREKHKNTKTASERQARQIERERERKREIDDDDDDDTLLLKDEVLRIEQLCSRSVPDDTNNHSQ